MKSTEQRGAAKDTISEQQLATLTAERDQAIIEGNRWQAARLQGQILGLKPITFPEAVRPARLWSTARIINLGSPYADLNGNSSTYLKTELTELAKAPVPSPARYFLYLAGVKINSETAFMTADNALETYRTARLVDEVGTYQADSGGVAYRTADGHLHAFRMPFSEVKTAEVISVLEAASFTPGALPLVITDNPHQSELAFADQR